MAIGIAIRGDHIEGVYFNTGSLAAESTYKVPIPPGVFGPTGDTIIDEDALANLVQQVVDGLHAKTDRVYLTAPSGVLRLVEMPRMKPQELTLSLSSEAEGYKAFDDTEALVSFDTLPPEPHASPNSQRVVFSAIRKDTLAQYNKVFHKIKLKVQSIEPEEMAIIRAMAGTGVLDSLVQQLGENELWGSIFAGRDRVRFLVWRGNTLIELREVQMPTNFDLISDPHDILIEDLVEETRRTAQASRGVPKVWLTHGVPPLIQQALAEQFEVPVRPCMVSPQVQIGESGLDLASLGAALREQLDFPFGMNLMKGKSGSVSKPGSFLKPAPAPEPTAEDEAALPWAVPVSIAAGVIFVLTYLVVFIMQTSVTSDLERMEQEKTTLASEQSTLATRLDGLKAEAGIRESIQKVAEASGEKNGTMVRFVTDLARLTPPDVWVHNVEFSNALKVVGTTLNDKAAVQFSSYLDRQDYLNAVRFDSIREDMVGPNPVFNFTVEGTVKEHLLDAAVPGADQSGATPAPATPPPAAAPAPAPPATGG